MDKAVLRHKTQFFLPSTHGALAHKQTTAQFTGATETRALLQVKVHIGLPDSASNLIRGCFKSSTNLSLYSMFPSCSRTPPVNGTSRSGGAQSPYLGGRGPAGRLPVTKEMGVISVTPLSGYGLALLDRLPVKPDHKPCAVPRRVAGGFSYGMSSEYMDQDVTFGFVGSVLA